MGARRATGHNDAVQAVLLDALLNQLERIGGAGIDGVFGVHHIRQVRGVLGHVGHVDHAGDVAAATAHKAANARLVIQGDLDLGRENGRLYQCAFRFADHGQRRGCRAACLHNAIGNVLWLGKSAADVHPFAGGLYRLERFPQRKTVFVEADAGRFGQGSHVFRRFQPHREHQNIEFGLNQRAIAGLIFKDDLFGLRVLAHHRDTAVVIDDAQFLPPAVIGIKIFAKGAHVHLKDVNLYAGHVFHSQHGFFGGVHAADGGAIVVVLIAGAGALQKGDALWLRAVGGPPDVAVGGAGGAEQAFELHGRDHVGIAPIAPLWRASRIIELVTGREYHRADFERLCAGGHIVVNSLRLAGIHAEVALGAEAAFQTALCFCVGLVFSKGHRDFTKV